MDLVNETPSLFLFYVLISAAFFEPLFSCRVRSFMDDSMFIRHILGFLNMLVFVVLVESKGTATLAQMAVTAVALYAWFVLSTRMNMTAWALVLASLAIVFLAHSLETRDAKQGAEPSPMLERVKKAFTGLALATTVIGVIFYFFEKQQQYGSRFSVPRFLLGNPICGSRKA
jgi:hypothetical protein